MTKRILVLGATGLFGKPAAQQLNADGFAVRIMARNVEKAKALFTHGFEIVEGNVTDLDALKKSMKDCHGVHISVGGPADQASAENVAALAPILGIQHITYISGATVKEENGWFPMVAQKLAAEKAIKECGVDFTIFCPTWPMTQIARFTRDGNPFMIGKQPLPVHFFAEQDFARVISQAYQKEEARNQRFYVYGPEAMTMTEGILRFCKVKYPEVTKVSAMPVWLAKLIATLTKNDAMKFAANLMGYFDKTPEAGDAALTNEVFGKLETSLESWIQEQA